MSLSVCLYLQVLARLTNGPVVQTLHYRHNTVVHVVVWKVYKANSADSVTCAVAHTCTDSCWQAK